MSFFRRDGYDRPRRKPVQIVLIWIAAACVLIPVVLLGLAMSILPGGGEPLSWPRAVGTLRDIMAVVQPGARESSQIISMEAREGHIQGRLRRYDLWQRPVEGHLDPALVLMPGAAPGGRRDSRLQLFARALAGAGFQVVIPELPDMHNLQISAEDADILGDAVLLASHLSGMENSSSGQPRKVGVMAISYGVGPSVLAMLKPEVREHVGFWAGIGGYYDLTKLLSYLAGQWSSPETDRDGPDVMPARYGRWVFVLSNAGRLQDPHDREILIWLARGHLRQDSPDVDYWRDQLGPEGKSVLDLLYETDMSRISDRIAALPAAVREEIGALDLSHQDLSGLTMPALLIHGQADPLIPPVQSRMLADALPEGAASLYLLDSFSHVESLSTDPVDLVKMLDATARLLVLRDSLLVH